MRYGDLATANKPTVCIVEDPVGLPTTKSGESTDAFAKVR